MTPTTDTTPELSSEMAEALAEFHRLLAQQTACGRPVPPEGETPEQRVARYLAWVDSHTSRNPDMDDSRESIY